jgi:ankyrin repeat protein
MKNYKQYINEQKAPEYFLIIKQLLSDYTYNTKECYEVLGKALNDNLDVNYKDNYGWTLLTYASYMEADDILTLLLLHPGTDAFITGPDNKDFIELYSGKDKYFTVKDRIDLINNTNLTDLDFQQKLMKVNPNNIVIFGKHGLIHIELIKDYPYLESGYDLNLL